MHGECAADAYGQSGLRPPPQTVWLLQALRYMHHIGVIHRDLKPQNVMFSTPFKEWMHDYPKCVPVIIDFGLADDLSVDHSDRTVTGCMGSVGAPPLCCACMVYMHGVHACLMCMTALVHASCASMFDVQACLLHCSGKLGSSKQAVCVSVCS